MASTQHGGKGSSEKPEGEEEVEEIALRTFLITPDCLDWAVPQIKPEITSMLEHESLVVGARNVLNGGDHCIGVNY